MHEKRRFVAYFDTLCLERVSEKLELTWIQLKLLIKIWYYDLFESIWVEFIIHTSFVTKTPILSKERLWHASLPLVQITFPIDGFATSSGFFGITTFLVPLSLSYCLTIFIVKIFDWISRVNPNTEGVPASHLTEGGAHCAPPC